MENQELKELKYLEFECAKRLIKERGIENQKHVAIEELSELIHALSRELQGREDNVIEEIGDVEIVLTQLKIIYSRDAINRLKLEKLRNIRKSLAK